jgi:WD40 repeat protein
LCISSRQQTEVVPFQTHDDETVAFVKDAIKFVNAFGSVISQSVPHIYMSALPFAPATSEIARQFLPYFPQTLFVETGRAHTWPAIQSVLEGHIGAVMSVAFSQDNKRIVSGSLDNTIRVWDAETGDVVSGPFEGLSGFVNSVAFSQDGKHIVSGSSDKTIRVWDAETGDIVSGPFEGHSGFVNSVAFSQNGKLIVSGSSDNTIRVWDAETGDVVSGPFEGHVDSIAFSQDGKQFVSGSWDDTIRV